MNVLYMEIGKDIDDMNVLNMDIGKDIDNMNVMFNALKKYDKPFEL